jgi:outer membrane lipoprotein SlyB
MKPLYLIPLLALLACQHPNQNRYGAADVGMNAVVEFGTIVSKRSVEITGQNSGAGALVGATAGAYGGSYIGSGSGSLGAALAGLVIGAAAGAAAEQAMQDRQGVEYVVTLESGVTQSIAQNIGKDDEPLDVGQRVMVQTSGQYRRVLPAEHLPEEIKRPKKIRVKD